MSDPRNTPGNVTELCDRYDLWAETYYRKLTADGKRRLTREHSAMRDALKALRAVAANKPIGDLRAEDLCEAQDWMVAQGYCRTLINSRVNRIRRAVKWATMPPRRWLEPWILTDMQLVEPLKPGRTNAPEPAGVHAVTWDMITATMAAADLQLSTMIELHWWTGMRPCELAGMRLSWMKRKHGGSMIYAPREHKCEHHKISRIIPIGPRGQDVLLPWLKRMPEKRDRLWTITTSNGYRQAVKRTNDLAKLAHWYPLQIRHAFATRVEREAGEAAAQLLLGHTSVNTTRRYIEDRDSTEIDDVMRRFG